jgi:hypothetical protein
MEMNELTNNILIVNNHMNEFDALFFNHLPLLMDKREQIFANPIYFMIPIRAILFYDRACLVAGRISCLPLGALLRIWSNEPTAIKPCKCGGTAVVVKSILASLSRYTYTTFCLQCHKTSKEMENGSSSHITGPFFTAQRTYKELALSSSDEILHLIRELK